MACAAALALLVLAGCLQGGALAEAGKAQRVHQLRAGSAARRAAETAPKSSDAAVKAEAEAAPGSTRSGSGSFLREADFAQQLRVCNAYPSKEEVDVLLGEVSITHSPLPYKTCRDLSPQLHAGDRLQFKVGEEAAGSFLVSQLPSRDAVLMLVVSRRDATSSAMAFESHVFWNLVNAQIAVLDTYTGATQASLAIQDARGTSASRQEELRYGSVVAVNPGLYEVALREANRTSIKELVALNGQSYVVLRCGLEARVGEAYAEEVMVFPQSDPAALAASTRGAPAAPAALLLAVLAAAWAAAA